MRLKCFWISGNVGPRTLLYRRIRALKSEKCNKTLISVQVYDFWYIFLFFCFCFNQIGHYWIPWRLCSKNSDQLPVLNRLADIFAVGKYDYDVMVRYQNLTWKPKLFRAPWAPVPLGPGPGTMYPLNPPLVGSATSLGNKAILRKKFVKYWEKMKYSRSNLEMKR